MNKTVNSPEIDFLLSLALSEKEYPLELIIEHCKKVNWGTIIELSIYHKMLPTLAFHLYQHNERLTKDGHLNFHLSNFFIRNYNINRQKKYLTLDISKRILDSFEQHQVPVVMNKGLVLESSIHFGDCRRQLGSDIDFMILPKDREKAYEILDNLDFKVGKYDVNTREIVEHSRQNTLIYKLNPDHLIRFTTKTNELICEYVDIDVANSFTWHKSDMEISMEEAFTHIEKIDIEFENQVFSIPKLGFEYEFIFVFMHLYREAWFYNKEIKIGQDVNIKKFYDVVQYLKLYEEVIFSLEFQDLLKKLGVDKAFKWVVIHTDNVFNTSFSNKIDTNDIDSVFLNSAFENLQKTKKWEGDMKNRLFSDNREALFKD